MATILVVEDDTAISELIHLNLKLVGHDCHMVYDGISAKHELSKQSYDLILLDVMLPGISGFDLMKYIQSTPVIFVTAKGQLEDKLNGLGLGAQDYIVKPFEVLELVARVHTVLNRCHPKENTSFVLAGVTVDLKRRVTKKDGQEIALAPQEFRLLEVLIQNKNLALSREQLLQLAWGYDYVGDAKTVDVHIRKLRKKLGWEYQIKTIAKLGYRLEVQE